MARWRGVLLACLAGGVGCGSGARHNCVPNAGTCEASCSHFAAASCGEAAGTAADCLERCRAQVASVPAACVPLLEDALACAACAPIMCPRRTCDSTGMVCIEEGVSVVGCEAASTALRACGGSCLMSPLNEVSGGSAGTPSVELKTSRCACPATLAPGGAAGADCRTESDCAAVCCACATGHGRYVIRACQDGRCVGDPEICAGVGAGVSSSGVSSTIDRFCAG